MSTTLNKLEYLNETKSQIKNTLNTKFNSQIQDTDTFRSYVSKIKKIYTNWPRVTGENTTLSLTPTKKGLMEIALKPSELSQDAEPSPESPQDIHTVSGDNTIEIYKNFFDKDDFTYETGWYNDNGVLQSSSVTGHTTNYIDVESNASYILSGIEQVYSTSTDLPTVRRIYYWDSSKNWISRSADIGANSDFTFTTPANAKYITLQVSLEAIGGTVIHNIFDNLDTLKLLLSSKIQSLPLNLGDLEYCKIGNYEDEFIRNNGKNLVSSKISSYAIGSNGRFASNSDYDMHIAQVIQGEIYTATTNDSQFVAGFFTELPTLNSTSYNSSRIVQNEKTFTAPITGYVAFRSLAGYTTPMLNSGTTALPYEPYGTGEWYLKKNVGKVVFDGSESTSDFNKDDLSNNLVRFTYIPLNTLGKSQSDYIGNYFTYLGLVASPTTEGISNSSSSGYNRLFITINLDRLTANTVSAFKTWLSTHNTIVYYVLATPTYTLLSDTLQTQLENIYKALSYDGQTNIIQINNDLPFIISASALMKGGN